MLNEASTRSEYIDQKLIKAGWDKIIPYKDSLDFSLLHKTAVMEYPTESGPADYALFSNGRLVAFVEAKKMQLGPQNVLSQAQRYVKGATEIVSFIYSTNGENIWFQDLRQSNSRSRQVQEFHTPKALIELSESNASANSRWLLDNPPTYPKLRYYQKDAIGAIETAISQNKRSMLVAMATGTGKTHTVVSLIHRLLKSGTSKRILFLVDRKALAAQTVMEFAAFEAEQGLKFNQIYQVYSQRFKLDDFESGEKVDFNVLPTSYLTDPDGNQVFVYVSTIQRMQINLYGKEGMFSYDGDYDPDDDADKLDIPINAFDTIIADECHRGYTSQEVSKWRGVLDHFDAIKIGLTATPAAHTTSYFKEIVYRYTYEKAVQDGYLVDYDAVKVESGVRLEGITLKEGEEVEQIDPYSGAQQLDLFEDERHFNVADIERDITAPDSNRKVIQEFAKYALEQEEELGRFPKTLIFAHNDLPHVSHADQLVDICRDVFGRGDSFVQKITGSPTVDRPLTRIKEFRNRPEPHIVVTVDMLSTGVDIPSIENIIFLRAVKSRILFEQMLGRGTRLCSNFPNGQGTQPKTHFTVFDCFAGTLLEAFKNSTGITQLTPLNPTRPVELIIDDINNNIDVEYNTRCLIKRFQRISKNVTAEGREMFAQFIAEGDIGQYAKQLPEALSNERVATLKTLTDSKFIDLLKHYPRPPKRFIRAIEQEDTVGSEYVFRTIDGRDLKPDDYIKQFEKFVTENPEHVEAISIILNKPKYWNTEALRQLRTTLADQPERFTENNLRRAYKYPLADIISMVKHAAKDEPLLSAKERVSLAMKEVLGTQDLTQEQEQWIDLIELHLVENLTVEPEDFNQMPIFINFGGSFQRINKDFGEKLLPLIKKINESVVKVSAYANQY